MNELMIGKKIIETLKSYQFEAYFVGGCVRDYLLKMPSHDIDITTNATPEEVIKIFPKVVLTGIKFGTVTVILDGYQFEVTTYRYDLEYENNRHPKVLFADNLADDLKRRDYTINALAMDENMTIIDLNQGKADLDKKIIRAVLEPNKRFVEDALRILRGFYFVSKLGFTIEEKTFAAMIAQKHLLKNLSSERIFMEMDKIFKNQFCLVAIKLLVKAKVHLEMPSISKGLEKLSALNNNFDATTYWSLCFCCHGEIDSFWKISNKERRFYENVIILQASTIDVPYNKLLLYTYGDHQLIIANRVNQILYQNKDYSNEIKENYINLPIKKTCDLQFKGQDILLLNPKIKVTLIGEIIDDIKYEIIYEKLTNDYSKIKEYVLQKYWEDLC